MKKLSRSSALVLALTFAAAPALHANRAGCDPHPQAIVAVPTTFSVVVSAVMTYFGM